MAFIIKLATILALTYATHASIEHEQDSYLTAALQSSHGVFPEEPIVDHHLAELEHPAQHLDIGPAPSDSYGGPIHVKDLDLVPPPSLPLNHVEDPIINGAEVAGHGPALASGNDLPYPPSPGLAFNGPIPAGLTNFLPAEPIPIGINDVQQGIPVPEASQYELHSVVQNIIRRIPVEVLRHVQVPVPHPVPVPGEKITIPVPHPVPVHVPVVKHVPYPIYKTQHVEVPRPVPYPVVRQVPVEVIRQVPVPVERPVEVIKHVHVPVNKHIEVPVPVWKPSPVHIIKHVTHYNSKWC